MEKRCWQGRPVDGIEPVVLTATQRGIDLLWRDDRCCRAALPGNDTSVPHRGLSLRG